MNFPQNMNKEQGPKADVGLPLDCLYICQVTLLYIVCSGDLISDRHSNKFILVMYCIMQDQM